MKKIVTYSLLALLAIGASASAQEIKKAELIKLDFEKKETVSDTIKDVKIHNAILTYNEEVINFVPEYLLSEDKMNKIYNGVFQKKVELTQDGSYDLTYVVTSIDENGETKTDSDSFMKKVHPIDFRPFLFKLGEGVVTVDVSIVLYSENHKTYKTMFTGDDIQHLKILREEEIIRTIKELNKDVQDGIFVDENGNTIDPETSERKELYAQISKENAPKEVENWEVDKDKKETLNSENTAETKETVNEVAEETVSEVAEENPELSPEEIK